MSCVLQKFTRGSECEPGSYVVYSASCAEKTAKVYVRGDRDTTVLNRRYVTDEGDGTVQCEFTGDYILTVVEKRNKRSYSLYGCE